MRPFILIALIAVALASTYLLSGTRPQPAAKILDAHIEWETLAKQESPVEAFASIVDERVGSELARRLGVDTSNDAARDYMITISPELFSTERVARDQAVAGRIADALELVYVEGIPAEDAYVAIALEDVMGESRWQEYVLASDPDHIPTLRTFAAAETPMQAPAMDEHIMSEYLSRSIRDAICALPAPYNNIRRRILNKVAGDVTDPLLKDLSVFEAECTIEQAAYLNYFLDDAVVVYRAELQDYARHLVVLRGANLIWQ